MCEGAKGRWVVCSEEGCRPQVVEQEQRGDAKVDEGGDECVEKGLGVGRLCVVFTKDGGVG